MSLYYDDPRIRVACVLMHVGHVSSTDLQGGGDRWSVSDSSVGEPPAQRNTDEARPGTSSAPGDRQSLQSRRHLIGKLPIGYTRRNSIPDETIASSKSIVFRGHASLE